MAKTKLKPCPFCGKQCAKIKIVSGYFYGGKQMYQLYACQFKSRYTGTRTELTKAWNRRVDDGTMDH